MEKFIFIDGDTVEYLEARKMAGFYDPRVYIVVGNEVYSVPKNAQIVIKSGRAHDTVFRPCRHKEEGHGKEL